jgi:hypothetical protein
LAEDSSYLLAEAQPVDEETASATGPVRQVEVATEVETVVTKQLDVAPAVASPGMLDWFSPVDVDPACSFTIYTVKGSVTYSHKEGCHTCAVSLGNMFLEGEVAPGPRVYGSVDDIPACPGSPAWLIDLN